MQGEKSLYHVDSRKCICKGRGVFPENSKHQVHCPIHKAKRTWPQLQKDGSVIYKELDHTGIKTIRKIIKIEII